MKNKVLIVITAFMLGALSGCADTDNSLNSDGSNGNGSGGGLNPSDIKCEYKYDSYIDNFKEYRDKFIHGHFFPASTPYDKYKDKYLNTDYKICPAISTNKYISGFYEIEVSEITPNIGTYKDYRDYVEILKKMINTNSSINKFTDKCGNYVIDAADTGYGCEFRGEMLNPRTGKVDNFGVFIKIDKQFKKVTQIMLDIEYKYNKSLVQYNVPLNFITKDSDMISPPKVTEVPFQ